jgi:hypothetical protein
MELLAWGHRPIVRDLMYSWDHLLTTVGQTMHRKRKTICELLTTEYLPINTTPESPRPSNRIPPEPRPRPHRHTTHRPRSHLEDHRQIP